jgi:hypothetical protein
MPLPINLTTAFWYVVTAVLGLSVAAVMLRRTTSRVLWWEWLALGARRLQPTATRVAFLVASCIAAVLVVLLTPILPE